MNTHASTPQEYKRQPVPKTVSQKQNRGGATFQFVDNRPETIAQRRVQEMANNSPQAVQLRAFQDMGGNGSQAGQPIQMMKYIIRSGKNYEVADDYNKKKKERWTTKEVYEANPSGVNQAEALRIQQEKAAEDERLRVLAVAEAERVRVLAAAETERKRLLAIREGRLGRIPLRVSRSDGDFNAVTNYRGQGKAHLTPQGLAPAGRTSISPADQLDQDSPHKGTSDRISFTGPNPVRGGHQYGGRGSESIAVKTRKIERAKAKGKPDAQHLEVSTSTDILGGIREERLRKFATKDDEHQVRVTQGLQPDLLTIPPRFLVGAGYDDAHDSDSDDDH